MAIKDRTTIRHSEPLEGDDAKRLVEDVENPPRHEERRSFLAASKGLFGRLLSSKSANHYFGK